MIQLVKIDQISNEQIIEYQKEFLKNHEIIHGSNGLTTEFDIVKWRKRVLKNEISPPSNLVPSTQFLLIDEKINLVGMLDLRHKLTPHLEKEGGHIGYSIRKSFRGAGYAKEGLRQALKLAKDKFDLNKVLLTCDSDNYASKSVILSSGGKLDNRIEMNKKIVERYWIELND